MMTEKDLQELGVIEPTQEPLTDHEKKIAGLIGELEGIGGFPDTPHKLRYFTVGYAEIASTEPYKSRNPESPKNGKVPAKLLIAFIKRSCEFMPAPIVAREMYEALGFKPFDGTWSYELPQAGRRREPKVRDEE
jgi:hypothetical protein